MHYSESDVQVDPYHPRPPKKPQNHRWILPSRYLRKVNQKELAKLMRDMDWFRMYRPLLYKGHPYTRIFKQVYVGRSDTINIQLPPKQKV